ncbi:MAG: chromosome segregation protein SMC, partial [Alphaproteobacteria bacterium]
MQFTRLRLLGFKSFVDPTEMPIAPGLTGVVGPNGCGKSNLLEALRWVMGENRPTAMRGSGMDDVIFAGAASRPARGHAEVTLTLDNSDRTAPAPFDAHETIELVRRITREAGSVFRANGKEVRARDVQILFADASTGAHSPALVRQGQIGELINARPKARRRILEEAAGISGLYQRRHEAELKLQATEANLERVADVLDQLDQRLALLARQARQAARYRQISEKLRRMQGIALYIGWSEADSERMEAERALTEALRATAAAEGAARARAREREEAEAALAPLREEEAIAAALTQRMTIERGQLDEAARRAEAEIAALQARIGQLRADIERESALDRDAGETLERLEAEGRALAEAAEGHEARLAAAEAEAERAAEALAQREARFDECARKAAQIAAQKEAAMRRCDAAVKEAARLRDATLTAEAALAALAADESAARTRLAGLEDELAQARAAAEAAEARL